MRKQQERRSGRQWLVAVLAVALGPVSYTHLDVYKRQGARLLPVFHAGRPAEKLEDHQQRKNARR